MKRGQANAKNNSNSTPSNLKVDVKVLKADFEKYANKTKNKITPGNQLFKVKMNLKSSGKSSTLTYTTM